MDETVLLVTEELGGNELRLTDIVDAFVLRALAEETLSVACSDIVMTTLRNGNVVQRKLVFQTGDECRLFLAFWKGRASSGDPPCPEPRLVPRVNLRHENQSTRADLL